MKNGVDVAVFDGVSSMEQFICINHTMFIKNAFSICVVVN